MKALKIALMVSVGSTVVVAPTARASDPILCGAQVATIVGTEGPDVIEATPGADVVVSLGGQDQISGVTGEDSVCAGTGDDTIVGNGTGVVVYGGAGNDWIEFSGTGPTYVPSSLYGDDGNDVLISEDNAGFHGGQGDDRLIGGPYYDQFWPGPGRDTIEGGGDTDSLEYGTAPGPVFVDMRRGLARGEGRDTFTGIVGVTGTELSDRILGDDGPNQLAGADRYDDGTATDRIRGRGGDDLLYGAGRMLGGTGDDALSFAALDGTNDHYDGGPGTDAGGYDERYGPLTVNLPEGTATGPRIGWDTLLDIERIYGSQYADTLIGDGADNVFDGGRADDHIEGGGGDDRLVGAFGNDDLDGGPGVDVVDGGPDRDSCLGETLRNCELNWDPPGIP